MTIEFVNLGKVNSKRFLDLVYLARSGKLTASTIVKVTRKDSLIIEVWRAQGATDLFGFSRSDIFDRVVTNGTSIKSAPKGVLTESDLVEGNCDILVTDDIVRESNFSKMIEKISSNYGFPVTKEAVAESRIAARTIIEV